jgi:hypothetical protein
MSTQEDTWTWALNPPAPPWFRGRAADEPTVMSAQAEPNPTLLVSARVSCWIVPQASFRELGDASRKNASMIRAIAIHAREVGDIGHSYALTIIAWEEFSKCFIYRMAETGVLSFELKNPAPAALLLVDRHIMRWHREKHAMVAFSLVGMEILGDFGFVQSASLTATTVPSREQLASVTPQMVATALPEGVRPTDLPVLAERIKPRSELLAKLRAVFSKARTWEKERSRGLYVDDRESGIGVPWDVTRSRGVFGMR